MLAPALLVLEIAVGEHDASPGFGDKAFKIEANHVARA